MTEISFFDKIKVKASDEKKAAKLGIVVVSLFVAGEAIVYLFGRLSKKSDNSLEVDKESKKSEIKVNQKRQEADIKVDQKRREADIKVNQKQREADIEVETARRKAEIKNNAKAGSPEKVVEVGMKAAEQQQPESFRFADIKEGADRSEQFIDLMGVPFLRGGAHLIASEAGVGKSTLATAMGEEFARKEPYGSVLYFDTEPSDKKYEMRYGKVKHLKPANMRFIPAVCTNARQLADLIKKEVGKEIANDILVVVDNVTGYGDNQRKESEDFFKDMRAFRDQQKKEDRCLTTLYVGHMKQLSSSKKVKEMGDVRCRPFLKDMSDMVMVLDRCKEDHECRELHTVKHRHGPELRRVYRLIPEEGNHHLERVDKDGEGDQPASQRPKEYRSNAQAGSLCRKVHMMVDSGMKNVDIAQKLKINVKEVPRCRNYSGRYVIFRPSE